MYLIALADSWHVTVSLSIRMYNLFDDFKIPQIRLIWYVLSTPLISVVQHIALVLYADINLSAINLLQSRKWNPPRYPQYTYLIVVLSCYLRVWVCLNSWQNWQIVGLQQLIRVTVKSWSAVCQGMSAVSWCWWQ